MKYIIVRVEFPSGTKKLSELVQEKIEEGYTPVGGMSTWNDKLYGRVYTQSMIGTIEEPETVGDKFIRGFMGKGNNNGELN
jgi:hypothetical protein